MTLRAARCGAPAGAAPAKKQEEAERRAWWRRRHQHNHTHPIFLGVATMSSAATPPLRSPAGSRLLLLRHRPRPAPHLPRRRCRRRRLAASKRPRAPPPQTPLALPRRCWHPLRLRHPGRRCSQAQAPERRKLPLLPRHRQPAVAFGRHRAQRQPPPRSRPHPPPRPRPLAPLRPQRRRRPPPLPPPPPPPPPAASCGRAPPPRSPPRARGSALPPKTPRGPAQPRPARE